MDSWLIDEDWIKQRIPKCVPQKELLWHLNFDSYYLDGLKIVCIGDRGDQSVVYTAKDYDDVRYWIFEHVCSNVCLQLELKKRKANSPKWRYCGTRADNGRWMYIEHKDYRYDAIEDTRLAWFEMYLRLLKDNIPDDRWEKNVKERIKLMNCWFNKKHWDYDRNKMCFVELSNSKRRRSSTDMSEIPAPDQIIKLE